MIQVYWAIVKLLNCVSAYTYLLGISTQDGLDQTAYGRRDVIYNKILKPFVLRVLQVFLVGKIL